MKALSLWQPWASLIADEEKRIETRSWRPPEWLLHKWLAIHAAKKIDKDFAYQCGYGANGILCPRGAIVAVVWLDSWIRFNPENTEYISDDEKRYGDFEEGRFGWQFAEIRKLPEPLPIIGRQGIFEVSLPIPR